MRLSAYTGSCDDLVCEVSTNSTKLEISVHSGVPSYVLVSESDFTDLEQQHRPTPFSFQDDFSSEIILAGFDILASKNNSKYDKVI